MKRLATAALAGMMVLGMMSTTAFAHGHGHSGGHHRQARTGSYSTQQTAPACRTTTHHNGTTCVASDHAGCIEAGVCLATSSTACYTAGHGHCYR